MLASISVFPSSTSDLQKGQSPKKTYNECYFDSDSDDDQTSEGMLDFWFISANLSLPAIAVSDANSQHSTWYTYYKLEIFIFFVKRDNASPFFFCGGDFSRHLYGQINWGVGFVILNFYLNWHGDALHYK